MNIVCYINQISGGGAERVMSVLANGLSKKGHAVTLVADYASSQEYHLEQEVHRCILDGDFVGATAKGRAWRTLRRIAQLRSVCKKQKADILISFVSESNARAILATRFLKTKNLISVRLDPRIAYKSRTKKLIARLLYPMVDGCVFQTEEAKLWFAQNIQRKSRIIFNPVSDAFYKVDPVPMAEKRIVSCGRLDRQKRFDLLIAAFDKICDDFPEHKLEIYGIGSLEAELQAQINALGRQNCIRLMGRCADVPNTIKNASLFVLSSDYEGLPNALMEAMALSLPVISTDCGGGGARELIENGADGLIVPCGDVGALAAAIRESLTDRKTAKHRGENAGKKAKKFSAESVVGLWEAYITHIVKGNG